MKRMDIDDHIIDNRKLIIKIRKRQLKFLGRIMKQAQLENLKITRYIEAMISGKKQRIINLFV